MKNVAPSAVFILHVPKVIRLLPALQALDPRETIRFADLVGLRFCDQWLKVKFHRLNTLVFSGLGSYFKSGTCAGPKIVRQIRLYVFSSILNPTRKVGHFESRLIASISSCETLIFLSSGGILFKAIPSIKNNAISASRQVSLVSGRFIPK